MFLVLLKLFKSFPYCYDITLLSILKESKSAGCLCVYDLRIIRGIVLFFLQASLQSLELQIQPKYHFFYFTILSLLVLHLRLCSIGIYRFWLVGLVGFFHVLFGKSCFRLVWLINFFIKRTQTRLK